MKGRLRLETFELSDAEPDQVALDRGEFEDAKLTSFEQGYAAGWDDAITAQDSETARLRADLGRNLLDLSFTYHEARSHVLHALEPLLRDMVGKVLPVIARQSLGQIVADHIAPLAEAMGSAPITVVAHPDSLAQIRQLLSQDGLPLDFRQEPSLGEGQVYLRLGDTETRIDLDSVIAAIGAAVAAFFHIATEETANG